MGLHLGIPEILMTLYLAYGMIFYLAMDGRPREGEYKGLQSVVVLLIIFVVLVWGGFYK